MCTPTGYGGAGAAGVGLGTAVNAYGQHQGLAAMRDAWGHALSDQQTADAATQARTQQLIAGLSPESVLGQAQGQAIAGQQDAAVRTAAAAVQGSRGAQPRSAGQASVQGQGLAGMIQRLLADGRIQALLQGLHQGQGGIDLLGRGYQNDLGMIRQSAHEHAQLAAGRQQAAGYRGAEARQIGTLFDQLGQGAISQGMSMPSQPGPASTLQGMPYDQAAMTEAPQGGWAANRPGWG